MRDYIKDIKIEVLLGRAIPERRQLVNAYTELDQAIIKVAGRVLRKAQRRVFSLAYDCVQSWDQVLDALLDDFGKDYELATVKEYASDAAEKVISACKTAEEVGKWQAQYFESQKKR